MVRHALVGALRRLNQVLVARRVLKSLLVSGLLKGGEVVLQLVDRGAVVRSFTVMVQNTASFVFVDALKLLCMIVVVSVGVVKALEDGVLVEVDWLDVMMVVVSVVQAGVRWVVRREVHVRVVRILHVHVGVVRIVLLRLNHLPRVHVIRRRVDRVRLFDAAFVR